MDHETSKRERSLRQLISAGSSDLDHYMEIADLLYQDGQLDATLAILTEASHLALPPQQRLLLAAAYYELGDHRAEAQVYRKVLGILREDEPSYWTCRLALARCEIELRRFEDASEGLQSIIKSAPLSKTRDLAREDLVSVRYAVAFRDYEAGDYATSIKELESLLRETSGDVTLRSDILLLLGHACVESKRLTQARRYYRELSNSDSTPEYHRKSAKESIALLPSD